MNIARAILLLSLALALVLPAAAASTNAPWININYDRSDSPASTNLVGPVGGAGAVWNILSSNIVNVYTTTNNNLLDAISCSSTDSNW